MVRSCLFACLLAAISGIGVAGQTDHARSEFFIGYSNNQVDIGISDDEDDFEDFFDDRQSFHGVNISGVGNLNRFWGVKGDFSAHFKGFEFDVPRPTNPSIIDTFEVDASLYNFLGGIQVKDNERGGSRFRPFGHALAGIAHARTDLDDAFFASPFCQQPGVDCDEDFSESDTGFAAAIGGGIDIRATDKISIRAIQLDWNPTRLGGSTQHNFRFGFGIVIH